MRKNWVLKASLSLVAVGILAGCGGAETTDNDETVNLGILQLMDHESLNATREGFLDVLEEAGYVKGENLNVDYQNAQLDQSNLQTMSERLSGQNDLILAIATPAAVSLANVDQETPILFTAITDPVDADLVESLDAPGGNLTGTTDAAQVGGMGLGGILIMYALIFFGLWFFFIRIIKLLIALNVTRN